MRKFRLIKKYPGSPQLDSIRTGSEENCRLFPSEKCMENNPEFWEEVKKPILTTEDGVDLYDRDDYWYVYLANYDIHKSIVSIYSETHSTSKTFSTRQAAKDYVNLHKPKFSKQDIITLLTDKFTYGGPVLRFSLEDILELFNCKDE